MISKKDITKLAKRVLKRQKGLRDHQMIHPQREWFIGILMGFILFVGGSIWSAQAYISVTERNIESAGDGEVQQTVYRTAQVEAALEKFRDRKDTYDELLENRVVPAPEVIEELEESIEEDIGTEELDDAAELPPPPIDPEEGVVPPPPGIPGEPPIDLPIDPADFDVPQ